MFQETMFYSGTGAYDYQYSKWVVEKYKYDKEWLSQTKSINVDILPSFYHSLKMLQQTKLNKLEFETEDGYREKLQDVFCLSKADVDEKNETFVDILENFVLDLDKPQNQNFRDIGDFNILSEKPVKRLPDGKYFLPMPFD